jgi:hypothetical protein
MNACLYNCMRQSTKFASDMPLASDGASWEAFAAAINTTLHVSCCGGGGSGSHAAIDPPRRHQILTAGYDAWRSGIKRQPPLLPQISGAYILPSVRIHGPAKDSAVPVDIIVTEQKIAAIIAEGDGPENLPRIEALRGHYVVPALTDMHVHMPADNALKLTPLFMLLQLRHGVVRVRDAGDPDGTATPAALAMALSGKLPGPAIHYAYAFVGDGRARWGNTLRMSTADQAPAIIEALQHAGASWVKAYENLDAERIAALVHAARESGLGVMGHVPTQLRVEEALLPDAQHLFGVPDPTNIRRDHVLNRSIDWASVDADRIAQVVEACARAGLAMTPTLSTSHNFMRLQDWRTGRDALDVALLPRMYPDVIWHPTHGLPAYRNVDAADFERAHDAWHRKLTLVSALAKAGVTLRLGTDTQQPFVVPGIALHSEIVRFAEAGIDRKTAWTWASKDAAAALGVPDAGAVEAGQRADLLLSASDPLTPNWAPSALSATICSGTALLAADMDAAIQRELGRFNTMFGDHMSRWLARFALNRSAKNFTG